MNSPTTIKELMHSQRNELDEQNYMLTTKDNPYDPWTEWDEWFAYDQEKGYGTCEYLARIAMTSYDMTDEENDSEITRAIDEIIAYDVLGIYKRAYEPVKNNDGAL